MKVKVLYTPHSGKAAAPRSMEIEDAVRSLERPPAASPWIPVTERLPVAGDHNHKLVRCRRWDNEVTWNRAWYDGQTWHGSGSMAGVEAWAEIDLQKEEGA